MKDEFEIMRQNSGQLLESIDFFAQNLSFEQIISYGYNFIHEILKFEESSIYVLEENDFVLKSQRNGQFKTKSFPNDDRMRIIATKFGRVMQKELNLYFDDTFLEEEKIALALPILVKDKMVGIIFSRNKSIDLNDPELALFFHGINQLINKASESAKNYESFKNVNSTLDRKIFNLLFINHSTKVLMSEMNIDRLYQLCIDVIRELTASSVTSFGMYDKVRQTIVLKGYKDILSFDEYYCEVDLKIITPTTSKIVYHVEEDFELLKQIFVNPKEFLNLKAKYIILLVKEEILGFVTIGETVSGRSYTKELLEQTESLISSIYIAIKNAQYFTTIKNQKEEISSQLDMMNSLNRAIKNINTCDTVDELCHIALQTLSLGFGIEKSMIVVKGPEHYEIISNHGFESSGHVLEISDVFKNECYDQTYFNPLAGDFKTFLEHKLLESIGESNCFVSVPLDYNENTLNPDPNGFLMIFKTESALKKGQIILLEALAGSIAPTIKQMNENSKIIETSLPNEEKLFILKLKKAIKNRNDFYTEFKVYFKSVDIKPFQEIDKRSFSGIDVFCFANVVLHIAYTDEFDTRLFDGKIDVYDVEGFMEELQMVI